MIFIFGGAYAGKEAYAKKNFPSRHIIRDVQLIIKKAMSEGKNPAREVELLIKNNPDAVFISDEIGCGIVPADKFEREWRETAGRIHCMLADKAESVIRVVCGIGIKLK